MVCIPAIAKMKATLSHSLLSSLQLRSCSGACSVFLRISPLFLLSFEHCHYVANVGHVVKRSGPGQYKVILHYVGKHCLVAGDDAYLRFFCTSLAAWVLTSLPQ
jgi:hypothetical protein